MSAKKAQLTRIDETRRLFFARYASGPRSRFCATWVEIDRHGFVDPSKDDVGTPVEDLGEGILFEQAVPIDKAQALVDEMLDTAKRGFVRSDFSALFV